MWVYEVKPCKICNLCINNFFVFYEYVIHGSVFFAVDMVQICSVSVFIACLVVFASLFLPIL